ncbi:MAG: helix-turn-helix domain-containing protein [Kiloniellaceae bacterium]
MATTLKDKMKALPPKRRKKVEARAGQLIAEELSLRDLRKARAKTQVAVAKELGINQEGVSRLEKRSDLMLSTLRNYINAMGGELHLVAEFPDRPPVQLQGLAALEKEHKTGRRASVKVERRHRG